jgi:hypothetical protein
VKIVTTATKDFVKPTSQNRFWFPGANTMVYLDRFFFCFAFLIFAKLCEASGPSHGSSFSIVNDWKARLTRHVAGTATMSQNCQVDHLGKELFPGSTATSGVGQALFHVRGGGWIIPAGYNPFGYKITPLGEQFLSFDGSLDCDVGRFLASLKDRKRFATLKGQWLEVVRVSKLGQSMRIYKNLQELLTLCLNMGLID